MVEMPTATVNGRIVPATPVFELNEAGAGVATGPSTGTQTSVNDTNADTTILAANTARKGAVIWNDSTAILYLLCGAGTSSATNWTYRLQPDEMLELPMQSGGVYSGVIKGIWSANASGAARITEFT